ncbi:WhiB family transcriptional regulator [Amycolatopsis sp. DSM 110486]|uniref:WhiB family transcriptional regulator n=1 Tax=Amycolatopsis sp. DSM 110486 TaxID=2865832 RepID=UPI001C697BB1|nr:WhiB family transcriptional regulator [Amycolatopsis sp. DSM 110486]QYN17569.1 WhiB family transcriptional regulator [Amycolatopsis sp. DSM 110486]
MTHWMERTNCGGTDPEVFHPLAEIGTRAYRNQVAKAKSICKPCPVKPECIEFRRDDPHSIAGGLTAEERRAHAH